MHHYSVDILEPGDIVIESLTKAAWTPDCVGAGIVINCELTPHDTTLALFTKKYVRLFSHELSAQWRSA